MVMAHQGLLLASEGSLHTDVTLMAMVPQSGFPWRKLDVDQQKASASLYFSLNADPSALCLASESTKDVLILGFDHSMNWGLILWRLD